MDDKKRIVQTTEQELTSKHSLVCNDELFIKDLIAIVDDTMRVEDDNN